MGLQVRPLGAEDYRSVAGIINLVEAPWQTNGDETRREDEDAAAAGGIVCHYVAVEEGRVVGHGVLRGGASSDPPQPYPLELRVHPERWGRGAGRLLWQRLWGDLDGLQPNSVRVWVRERCPKGLAFARSCGFAEVSRTGPWTLVIAEGDDAALLPASGLVLTTLAEERKRAPSACPPFIACASLWTPTFPSPNRIPS